MTCLTALSPQFLETVGQRGCKYSCKIVHVLSQKGFCVTYFFVIYLAPALLPARIHGLRRYAIKWKTFISFLFVFLSIFFICGLNTKLEYELIEYFKWIQELTMVRNMTIMFAFRFLYILNLRSYFFKIKIVTTYIKL